jgi:hypothetical protein
MRIYNLEARIEEAKRRDLWTCSYIEAHIWDPDIQLKAEGGVAMHPWSVPTKNYQPRWRRLLPRYLIRSKRLYHPVNLM